MLLTDELVVCCQRARAELFALRFDDESVRRFGDAVAFQWGKFNRVMCLTDAAQLDAIFDWYRTDPVFDVLPLESNAALTKELAARGFYQSRCHSLLACKPRRVEFPEFEGVAVEPAVGDALFIETYMLGYEDGDEEYARQLEERFRGDYWRLFLARVDGEPAAAGTLGLVDGAAYLPNAATIPRFRRRGCQQLLLLHRIDCAARAGLSLVVSDTPVNSDSQRNMERAGLQLVCQLTQWVAVR